MKLLRICQPLSLLTPQPTEMDKDSTKEPKEPQNGSTDQTTGSQTKDNAPEKAAALQKNVSIMMCPWEQVS